MHKSELSDPLNATLSEVDLPLHPKSKLLLHNKYLLSKLSWHFTVANLPKTWICEHLYNTAAKYLRKWFELPLLTTLSNIVLPYNKFSSNNQLPFTKFIQCQTVLRNAIRTSPNKDIQALWKSTFSHTNIQHDTYINTKDALKAIHNDHEDSLKDYLTAQGSFFSNVIDKSLFKVIPVGQKLKGTYPRIYSIFPFDIC